MKLDTRWLVAFACGACSGVGALTVGLGATTAHFWSSPGGPIAIIPAVALGVAGMVLGVVHYFRGR